MRWSLTNGGKDPGAVGYIKEADANLVMAQGCMDYLKEHGVEVAMSRYKDENDTTEEAIVECNAYKPDLAVDIHANSGGGDGFEVFYHHLAYLELCFYQSHLKNAYLIHLLLDIFLVSSI